MSSFYADQQFNELSDFGKNKNKLKQYPYSLKQVGTIDFDALIWSVSDKLKSKINRIAGKNAAPAPNNFAQEEGVDNRTLADAGPYGIGFAATDRLWQAEEARLYVSAEDRRAERRRYVLAGLLLILMVGVLGYAWSGSEPVPVLSEPVASVTVDRSIAPALAVDPREADPREADPLVALADAAADMPVHESLASPPMLSAAAPQTPALAAQPAGVPKAHVLQPHTQQALPIHHDVRKAPTAPEILTVKPLAKLSSSVTKARAVERTAPASAAKVEPLKPQSQAASQVTAGESQPSTTTHQQASLVRIVRPPADIGSKPGQPEQAGSHSSAFASASPSQASSNRTAQNTSSQGSSTPYNPQPLHPPADIRDTPPPAEPKKPAPQGLKKPSLVDAMFPRLYLLSEALK